MAGLGSDFQRSHFPYEEGMSKIICYYNKSRYSLLVGEWES